MEIHISHKALTPEFYIQTGIPLTLPPEIKIPVNCFLEELNFAAKTKSSRTFQFAIVVLIPILVFVMLAQLILVTLYCLFSYSKQCEIDYTTCTSHPPDFFFNLSNSCDQTFVACVGQRRNEEWLLYNGVVYGGIVAGVTLIAWLFIIMLTAGRNYRYWKIINSTCEKWRVLFDLIQENGQKTAILKKSKKSCFFSSDFSVKVVVFLREFDFGNQVIFRTTVTEVNIVPSVNTQNVKQIIEHNQPKIVIYQLPTCETILGVNGPFECNLSPNTLTVCPSFSE